MSEHLLGHSFLFIKYLTLESHSKISVFNIRIFVIGTYELYRSDKNKFLYNKNSDTHFFQVFTFYGKEKPYEEIKLLSFAARDSRSPSVRKSFQREKRAFSHYYHTEGEGGKEIARNVCEKVQSRILHLAFRVSKRHSIEKSASCAIAFSRERAR